MNNNISFAQINCQNFGLLINQIEIQRTIRFNVDCIVPTKYQGFYLYNSKLEEELILLIDLMDFWKKGTHTEQSQNIIFVVGIRDKKNERIFRRIVKNSFTENIKSSTIGIIAPNDFAFVNINPTEIKLFPKLFQQHLVNRGVMGLVFVQEMVLYWVDLEKMAYRIIKKGYS